MYERDSWNRSKKRRRGGRRRARRLRTALGAAGIGLLLMGAGKALGEPVFIAPAASIPVPALVQTIEELPARNQAEKEETGPKPPEAQGNGGEGEAGLSQADKWELLLVNPWTPLPEDYEVSLTQLKNGLSVDERCYPFLQEMMDDCRAAGLSPVICSAYRTWE